MQTSHIRIFCASSIFDLPDERMALGDFERQLNDLLENEVETECFLCENADIVCRPGGAQDGYDAEVLGCDLFLLLVRQGRLGIYSQGEALLAALSHLLNGSPRKLLIYSSEESRLPKKLEEVKKIAQTAEFSDIKELKELVLAALCELHPAYQTLTLNRKGGLVKKTDPLNNGEDYETDYQEKEAGNCLPLGRQHPNRTADASHRAHFAKRGW